MGRCRGSTRLGNDGVCPWDPLDPREIHPPRRLSHGSGRRRSRRSAAHGRLARVSRSSQPWRSAELLLPSNASARPDTGTHGRRCLERELHECSNMAAGRAPATFSCLCSARHGEAWEASPRRLASSASSAMAAGRATPAISWGCRLERDTGTYSRRSSAMAAGRAPAVSYLRSAGEQDAWLFAPGWSLGGSAVASSSSAGLDAWIQAQSRSMTLSEHRKLEEVRIVHVQPKAMCVHPQRSRLGTSSA
jgi:hypothetical protein